MASSDETCGPLSRSTPGPVTERVADMRPIRGARDLCKEFRVESKRMWCLAGPAVFISVCHYSLGVVTQMFAGQLGTLELAAVSVGNYAVSGFSFAVLIGLVSALQTLCGQAYGAQKLEMMGVYLQRSWVISTIIALVMIPVYVFCGAFLRFIGIEEDISIAAGKFSIYLIPQLFANAIYFPSLEFLQAQSKFMVMAMASAATLAIHALFSWLVMLKLGWGLKGAALVLNTSYWLLVVVQLVYIFRGACGRTWAGFSCMAFHSLWAFLRLSIASAVMICLDIWYFPTLVLFAGHLKNAKVSLVGLTICMNILSWTIMVAIGYNVAASIRVSNELGAGHPKGAKFSVVVILITSTVIGLILSLILIITRRQYPLAFTSSQDVKDIVHELTPLLAVSIIVNNVQPVLSGVAVGAGWQTLVAYVNIGCFYAFGLPLGIIMGYKLGLGVKGIWYGMLSGTMAQMLILIYITYRTDWNTEASIAGERVKHWGQPEKIGNEVENCTR